MPRIVIHPTPPRARKGGGPHGRGGRSGGPGVTDELAGPQELGLRMLAQQAAARDAAKAKSEADAKTHLEHVQRNRELLAALERTDPGLKDDPRYGYLRGVADSGGDLSHAVQFVAHERDQRAAADQKQKAKDDARSEQGNRSHLLLDGLAKELPGFKDSFEFKALRYQAENGGDVMPGVQRWITEQERAQAKARAIAPAVPEDEAVKMLAAAEPTISPERLRGIIQSQRAGITGKFHVSEAGAGGAGHKDPAMLSVSSADLAAAFNAARESKNLAQMDKASTALALRKLTVGADGKLESVPTPIASAAEMARYGLGPDGNPLPESVAPGPTPAPAGTTAPTPAPAAAPGGPVPAPAPGSSPPAPNTPVNPAAAGGPVQGPAVDPVHANALAGAVAAFTQQTGHAPDPANPGHKAALRALFDRTLAPPLPPPPVPEDDQDPRP